MNVLSRAAVLSLSVVALAGCASMDDQSARVSPRTIVLDQDYISRVEHVAQRRGVNVTWVNPPTTDKELVAQRE